MRRRNGVVELFRKDVVLFSKSNSVDLSVKSISGEMYIKPIQKCCLNFSIAIIILKTCA